MLVLECCRLLVVNPDRQVLICHHNDDDVPHRWDLPYFSSQAGYTKSAQECISHFHQMLGLDPSSNHFTAITDIVGDRICTEKGNGDSDGYARLILLDTHDFSFKLPDGCEWKCATFLEDQKEAEGCLCEIELSMSRAAMFIRMDDMLVSELRQPRFQFGWFQSASRWLQQIVEEHGENVSGPVLQLSVCAWTSQLRVESSGRGFYLKAPTVGTLETRITEAIHKTLPEMTLPVVGVSEKLGCFASREFRVVGKEERETGHFTAMMVKALGEFHLASLKRKDMLMEMGCPVLDLPRLHEVVDEIVNDEDLKDIYPGFISEAAEFAPTVKSMISRLENGQYDIPLVLTHGDFCNRNVGFRKSSEGSEKMILFDWQYAWISHPFFDLNLLKDESRMARLSFENGYSEEYFDIEDGLMDEYLEIWSEYEPAERCREAFELAYPLGWLLKCYTTYKCFRAARYQEYPSMANYLTEFWFRLSAAITNSKAYESSTEE